jgi:nucleoside-diphosphate-sugar epimerase
VLYFKDSWGVLSRLFLQAAWVPTVRAQFQNVYGRGEVLGAGGWKGAPAKVWRKVTPTLTYKSLKGQNLSLENRGISYRDFIYVDYIVEGLMLCVLRGALGQVYNVVSGIETTIKELSALDKQAYK